MTRATRALALSCAFFLTVATACAQQAPMPPHPPQMPDKHHHGHEGRHEGGEHGMGIVPPGTWWKNPKVITLLTLTPDQGKRLDDILRENRLHLVDVKAALEKEQINLDPILSANPPDQGKALAEISRIADLRADLEKANAKMLLTLRGVLTADQWTKLQQSHGGHEGDRGGDHRRQAPDAPGPGRGGKGDKGRKGHDGPPDPMGSGNHADLGNPPMPPPAE